MLWIPIAVLALAAALWLGLNLVVRLSTAPYLCAEDSVPENFPVADAILILGAGVRKDNSPSNMLEDRLLEGFRLYEAGVSKKIIVSGDHGTEGYDEVGVMKDYLVALGVPSENVYKDHAGFSTYDSLYRAKAIFGAESLVIVTQQYHAYRALYIARSFGISCRAFGAPIRSSDTLRYPKQNWYSFRESIARCKDLIWCIFKPEPAILGEPVSLSCSGDLTDDAP